jgi:uncharacterized protein YuzB (UPF0349 family)
MDRLEELYENFIDRIINDYPLTTNRSSDYDDAININQQIINRISNIRRYLTDAEHTSQDDTFTDAVDRRQGTFDDAVDRRQGLDRQQGINARWVYQDNYSDIVESWNGEYVNGEYINDEYINNIEYVTEDLTLDNMLTENTSRDFEDFTEVNNHIIDTLFNYVVNTTFSDFTYTDLNELNDVKITLSKEQFDKFEKMDVSESDKLTNCSICMDNYELNEKMIILKCNHTYHEKCIENWLCNQKVTCPICRKDTREMLDEREML